MEKHKSLNLKYIAWIVAACVLGVSVYFGYYIYYTSTREMAEQFNTQQIILAQEAATGIEEYLGSLRRNMQVLNQLNAEDPLLYNKVAPTFFEKFQDTALADIWLVSTEGVITATTTHPQLKEHNISEEVYFLKAQESAPNQIYTSGVFKLGQKAASARNNKWIILSLRLHDNSENSDRQAPFLMFLVSVNKIIDKFVLSIRSGQTGYAWLLDDNGTLLHHPEHPEMIDRSIFASNKTCESCHFRAFELEKQIVLDAKPGRKQYTSASGEPKLIAFSPIYLGSRVWTIAVSAPYSEVIFSLLESYYQLVGLLVVIGFTTLVTTIFILKINKQRLVAENQAMYAKQLEKEVAERTHEIKQEKQKQDDIVSAVGAQLSVINRDMHLVWVNKQVEKEFGRLNLEHKHCYRVYYQRQEPCPKCPALKTFEDGAFHQTEQLTILGNKKAYHQITTTPIYNSAGEVEQVLELTQNITLQKHQEQNLIDSKKMLAVGQIAVGLAHDLGNPLSIVAGSAQFCLKNLKPTEEIKTHLEVISRNVTAASKVIKALLQFARPSEETIMVAVNLPEVIQRTLLLLGSEFSKKRIKALEDYPQGLPAIQGDKSQLEQVFVNIVLNSVEALPEGGELRISARADHDNQLVYLSFADNGPGILPEYLENVFDPFFTTRVRGVGLGLSISKRIIESHQGTINAENLAAGGAKFTICLPFASNIKLQSKG